MLLLSWILIAFVLRDKEQPGGLKYAIEIKAVSVGAEVVIFRETVGKGGEQQMEWESPIA